MAPAVEGRHLSITKHAYGRWLVLTEVIDFSGEDSSSNNNNNNDNNKNNDDHTCRSSNNDNATAIPMTEYMPPHRMPRGAPTSPTERKTRPGAIPMVEGRSLE